MRDLKQPLSSTANSVDQLPSSTARRLFVLLVFAAMGLALALRAVYLQVWNKDFLQSQAKIRQVRTIQVPTHRGGIFDRNGEPLAISIPVDALWVNPKVILKVPGAVTRLADAMQIKRAVLQKKIDSRAHRAFLYLERRAKPSLVDHVMALALPGVHTLREYRRFYPDAESSAQVVGFTNVDDQGQEGVELAFNQQLTGTQGVKRVILDGRRNAVENIERVKPMQPGQAVHLSIDRRLQFLTYRALGKAVAKHQASSASAVILDVQSGEILAMANYPSFNPNNHSGQPRKHFRNRVVTDVFEPGSTMKPFTVANALTSGQYDAHTLIDTSPGYFPVGRLLVRDFRNYETIDVTEAITVSSNVAVAKMALATEPEAFWSMLNAVGFGHQTDAGFPGEVSGTLHPHTQWGQVGRATLAYGYGVAVTPLQLAQAYCVLADDGRRKSVSLLKVEPKLAQIPELRAEQIIPADVARKVRRMMGTVVTPKGTGRLAAVAGYKVAGKTGTVKKSIAGGYAKHRYLSVFSGMIPADDPKLVMVIMVNDPRGKEYYGGRVAAPVFSEVMSSAMRILGVVPDDLPQANRQFAQSDL